MTDSVSTAESLLSNQARAANAAGWISVRAYDVQTLLATVRSLRSRLESAEADSKRLDRVEQERLSVEFWIIDADGTLECNVRDPDDEFVATGKTLRDAIDAAQSPSNQGKTNG